MDNNKKTIEEKILDAEESVIDPDVSATEGGAASSIEETAETVAHEESPAVTSAEGKPAAADDDDGFTDEVDLSQEIAAQDEKKVEEAKPAEPTIDLYKEEEAKEEDPAAAKKELEEKSALLETEEDLQAIEAARQVFYSFYKKASRIKWIITVLMIVIVAVAWIVPSFIQTGVDEEGNAVGLPTEITLGIGIGGIVLMLAILLGFNVYYKKRVEKAMSDYFNSYYTANDNYVFGGLVSDRTGNVDCKIKDTDLTDAGLYRDVFKVGSRDAIEFTYNGHKALYCDCSASVKGQKSLATVFVGKMMRIDNDFQGNELLVYLKGNKRALPPTTLEGRNLIEDTKTMLVYGEHDSKRLLTKEVRNAIANIATDSILVDLSILVKPGKTYFFFGYEDSLMVLPYDKSFDPKPTMHLKDDTRKTFALVDALDKAVSHLH